MADHLAYCVHHAITSSSDGYAIRGHGIAKAIKKCGISLKVLVAPSIHTINLPYLVTIDGVDYLHIKQPVVDSFLEFFRVFKIDVVLAASNWKNAMPAMNACHQLGLPFWYEVRGFWELSRCAQEPDFEYSMEFNRAVNGENLVARTADHVFTLNRHMAAELVRRDVPLSRISLVPNGLDAIPTTTSEPSPALLANLGLAGSKVIAYIGSFALYEGLEDLIYAFASAREEGLDARLLLVGSHSSSGTNTPCKSSDRLRILANQLGVADHIVMTGRVPPQTAASLYPLVDLLVIPRRPERVCEIVSPLKPLEAAAQGTQLLVSSVPPLADLQSLGPGVHLFEKGSVDALSQQLTEILRRPSPSKSVNMLYPNLDKYLWSHSVESILEQLRKLPSKYKRFLSC